MDIAEFDIWDRIGVPYGGYNSAVDQQVFDVAKAIVDARNNDTSIYCDDIAVKLGLSKEHVELIQYLLASVKYEDREHLKDQPFEYGTSPRGLFVADEECAKRFMEEFKQHMKQWAANPS